MAVHAQKQMIINVMEINCHRILHQYAHSGYLNVNVDIMYIYISHSYISE